MNRRGRFDLPISALFLAAIALPLLAAPFGPPAEERVACEVRPPAPDPRLPATMAELSALPGQCEAWFDDRYGLRNELLAVFSRVRMFVFGVAPTSQVVLGREKRVFLAGPSAIPAARGLLPFAPERLDAWRRAIESRLGWCASRGIRYRYVIAPEKTSIYADELPPSLGRHGPTRTDQVLELLGSRRPGVLLDLRPALLAERASDRGGDETYFPFGVHWTMRGAVAGSSSILEALREWFPALEPLRREKLRWVREDSQGDNWAGRLHVEGVLEQEDWEARGLDREHARFVSYEKDGEIAIAESDDARLPRLVMFHDSFGPPLRDLLAEHFSRSVFVWNPHFDVDLIEREHPDVVLDVFAERAFVNQTPVAVHDRDSPELRHEFESSPEVLLALDVRADPPEIQGHERLETWRAEDGVGIRCRASGGTLFLPEFRVPDGARAVMRIELSCSAPDDLVILYLTGRDREYQRRNAVAVPLVPGRNLSLVELPESGLRGPLLLRFGTKPGEHVLHALEVRALRSP